MADGNTASHQQATPTTLDTALLYHLSPNGGVAGFVLAKGALTNNTTNEAAIRKALIEDDLIDCIVNLPAKLF